MGYKRNSAIFALGACAALLAGCRSVYYHGDKDTQDEIRALASERSAKILEGEHSLQNNASGMLEKQSAWFGSVDDAEQASQVVLTGELTLEECVKLALLYNIELIKQQLVLDKAGYQTLQAIDAMFPQLNLSADANTLTPYDDPDKESYDIKLILTQPLWRGGALSAGYRYANYEYEKTRLELWMQRDEVLHRVSSLYYEILLKQELVAVYQSAVEVSERLYNTTQSKFEGGTVSQYEVLRAEVEVANAKAELIREENELSELMLLLYNLMGVSEASNATLIGELVVDETPLDTSNASHFALNNRVELLVAMCEIQKAKENIAIVRAEKKPHVDLYASGGYGNSRGEASDWEEEWQVGVSASMRLDDNDNRMKIRIAYAELEQAEAELQNQEKNILTETANAIMQLAYAERYYESQKKNKELSEEVLRMVEEGFRVGKNTQVEVLDARAALTEAVGGYYKSIYTLKIARLNYNLAIGNINADALDLF